MTSVETLRGLYACLGSRLRFLLSIRFRPRRQGRRPQADGGVVDRLTVVSAPPVQGVAGALVLTLKQRAGPLVESSSGHSPGCSPPWSERGAKPSKVSTWVIVYGGLDGSEIDGVPAAGRKNWLAG